MKRKTFNLRCTPQQAAALAQGLRSYADAAYPPGGSECTQVARQTLFDSANTIECDAGSEHGAELRRRQRGIIRASVHWYFGPEGPGPDELAEPMLALFAD